VVEVIIVLLPFMVPFWGVAPAALVLVSSSRARDPKAAAVYAFMLLLNLETSFSIVRIAGFDRVSGLILVAGFVGVMAVSDAIIKAIRAARPSIVG
jgi:hypothetical protein